MREKIKNTRGKIFGVDFIKKNGEIRRMACRLQVKSYLKGGNLKYNPKEKNYIIVFDMNKRGYRTLNLNTLKRFKFRGEEICF